MTNDSNPNNYPGVRATVVGFVAGNVEVKEFANGNAQAEFSIPINDGYKKGDEFIQTATTWYTVAAAADYAAESWPTLGKGDKVRVDDAKLEAREFTRKDGSTGQAFTLRFGTVTVIESKSGGSAGSTGDFTPGDTSGGF